MNNKYFDSSEVSSGSSQQVHCALQNVSMNGSGVCSQAANKSFKFVFVMGTAFLTSYATTMSPQFSEASGVHPTVTYYNHKSNSSDDSRKTDLTYRLENIKVTLGLPISSITHFFNISRQTYYDWLRGGNPRDKKLQKVVFLDEIANHWSSLNSPIPFKTVLYAKYSEGKFLFDALADNDLKTEEVISFITKYVNLYVDGKERFNKV